MEIVNENGLSFQLNNRLKNIQELQKLTIDRFGDDDYNVFLFGSYLTERFDSNKSDVDIAIYTTDFLKYLRIKNCIEDFFFEKGVPLDIFYIDTSVVAPVYVAPLASNLRFTTYFPQNLSAFYKECLSAEE